MALFCFLDLLFIVLIFIFVGGFEGRKTKFGRERDSKRNFGGGKGDQNTFYFNNEKLLVVELL